MVEILAQLFLSMVFFGGLPFSSVSVDMWTAQHANTGYAAMDLQFGTPNYGIGECTLAVGYMPGTVARTMLPTSRSGWRMLSRSTISLRACRTCTTVQTDAADALQAARDRRRVQHPVGVQAALGFVGSILYCMAHKLHLCVKRAIGQYGKPAVNAATKALAEKHRKMLTHFTKSPKNLGFLLQLQLQ